MGALSSHRFSHIVRHCDTGATATAAAALPLYAMPKPRPKAQANANEDNEGPGSDRGREENREQGRGELRPYPALCALLAFAFVWRMVGTWMASDESARWPQALGEARGAGDEDGREKGERERRRESGANANTNSDQEQKPIAHSFTVSLRATDVAYAQNSGTLVRTAGLPRCIWGSGVLVWCNGNAYSRITGQGSALGTHCRRCPGRTYTLVCM